MKEIWGRYYFANSIKGQFDLITNLDGVLDIENPNLSYWTLRSLIFWQLGKGWFADIGPLYRGDFASNITYQELRFIGSIHYLFNLEDWSFRNRLRMEKRWIKEGPRDALRDSDPFRIRVRLLFQKNQLTIIDERMFAYVGPEFFFEENINRNQNIDLGSIRWIFSIGRLLSNTLSFEVIYWHRQYVNQEEPNFGSLLFRVDQVF